MTTPTTLYDEIAALRAAKEKDVYRTHPLGPTEYLSLAANLAPALADALEAAERERDDIANRACDLLDLLLRLGFTVDKDRKWVEFRGTTYGLLPIPKTEEQL
jgi:hypothetical protein